MPNTKPTCTFYIQRLAHFSLENVLDHNWRRLRGCEWIPEDKLRAMPDDVQEEAPGDSVFDDKIFENMVDAVLGFDGFKKTGLVESITGGGTYDVVIDLDESPYTPESLNVAFQKIVEHVNGGRVFTQAEPYTRNNGSETYYDPERIVPKFVPPADAVKCLVKKPKKVKK